MGKKKNNRKRKTGWALTKRYPHERHPAHYRIVGDCKGKQNDEIEYITFTHSSEVVLSDSGTVKTVCMYENVSKSEREQKKQGVLSVDKHRSYAYPKVYEGKRSALGAETKEFSYADDRDKLRSDELFATLPREKVLKTGGNLKHKNKSEKNT